MDVLGRLKWRYATKKFDATRLLSDNKIELLKQAFRLTASSYGLQPVVLIVVKNKTIQKKLQNFSFNQQQVGQASHVLIFCIENKIDPKYIEDYFNRVKKVRRVSDDILNPFKIEVQNNFKAKQKEETQNWATNQAYLAMGNLLTVCALEEIDACPMEGFEPLAYDSILKLSEKDLRAVLVMPVGYRAKDDFFSGLKKVRKELHESVVEIF